MWPWEQKVPGKVYKLVKWEYCYLMIHLFEILGLVLLQSKTHVPSISSRQVEVFHGRWPTQLNGPKAMQLISWNYWLFGTEMYSHQDLVKWWRLWPWPIPKILSTGFIKTQRKTALINLPDLYIWLVVSMIFLIFTPTRGTWSHLTGIFFTWVGSTTN